MIAIRGADDVDMIADVDVEHHAIIKDHFEASFLRGRGHWNPDIEGHAAYFEEADALRMYPVHSDEYEWLDPTIWENVELLYGEVYAVYVVLNNSNCSVAYVPKRSWVPSVIGDMLVAFTN
jgi:hypothetical protein